MYIPSLDMGEYDDYSSRTPRLPPGAPQDRHTDRQRDRHTDRKRMEQQFSRIPSGYFIVEDQMDREREVTNKTTRIPIRRENSQSRIPIRRENSQSRLPIRRENSQSSLYSSHHEDRGDRNRTLPRQSSRSRLAKQESRGSLRRQQSASRISGRADSSPSRRESVCRGEERERDVYTGNKNVWQNSLRGAGRTEGDSGRGRCRQARSYLDPAPGRRSRSKSVTRRSPSPSLLEPTFSSRAKTSGAPPASLPRRSSGVSRPTSGDPGYSRPPPAIVRRSASPDTENQDNPFANYRTFDQFKSTKHLPSQTVRNTNNRSGDCGERNYSRMSSHRPHYTTPDVRKVSSSSTESDSCFGSFTGTTFSEDRSDSRLGLMSSSTSSSGLFRNQESYSSYGAGRTSKASSGYSSSRSTSPTKFSLGALKRATISSWDE